MRSAGGAIGWGFRRRHRWALIALAVYIAGLSAIKLLFLGASYPIRLDPPSALAGFIIAPLTATFFYFVGAFSFGLTGDLAARESIYPARMFTLPVTTAALAGWPMIYGASAVASLWVAAALLARWLGGLSVAVIWPALLMTVFLLWTQALAWFPYGLPGLRAILTVLWLAALDTGVLLAIHYKARESVMVAILAPQIPLAYVVARIAVARARRGDVADWRGAFARLGRIADVLPRRDRFRSPAQAQVWLEWRRRGGSLPAMAAAVVPCELLLLFVPGNRTAPVVVLTLIVVLLTPPFLALFAAARQSESLTPFAATRPLATTSLIAASLTMAIWSTLAVWLLVLAAIPLALALSGTWPLVSERAGHLIDVTGPVRAIAIVLLVLAGLMASTWKQLVQTLCIGMTGRRWLIRSSVLLALIVLTALGPVADSIITDASAQRVFFDVLPWTLVVLVCLKMPLGAWVVVRLSRSGLLSDAGLLVGAVGWLAAVCALYGVLVWFVSTPLVPRDVLGAIAILEVPLVRLSAAPLALAWSRHR